MNKTTRPRPRLILTKGQLCWLMEHPDNDDLNQALIDAYGEITPLPCPYTSAASYEYVAGRMAEQFPNHDIMRGNDFTYPVVYLQVLTPEEVDQLQAEAEEMEWIQSCRGIPVDELGNDIEVLS